MPHGRCSRRSNVSRLSRIAVTTFSMTLALTMKADIEFSFPGAGIAPDAFASTDFCRQRRGLDQAASFSSSPAALDFEALVRVLDGTGVRRGGDGGVPQGLYWPALFGLVDRGDCRSH